MAADPDFIQYVMEQLKGCGDISGQRMFGGYGIRERGAMFALISPDSALYFKIDDETRPRYEAEGSHQFRAMPYWSVPPDVLEDRDQLQDWAEEAITVGHATAAAKRRRRTGAGVTRSPNGIPASPTSFRDCLAAGRRGQRNCRR